VKFSWTSTLRWVCRAFSRLVCLFLLTSVAHAQPAWPSRPVKLVVPYPAGGPTDTVSRLIGEKLAQRLNTSFVVENRPGASGAVAASYVAKSPADGYTLMMLGTSTLLTKYIVGNTSYDILKDFAPVATVYDLPIVMVVNPKVWPDVHSLQDVITKAKAASEHGNLLNYTSSAPISVGHLTTETLKDLAHFDMQHIPYPGGSQAVQALLGGQVPVGFLDIIVALPHIQAGKLRAVAVGGPTRVPMFPDVETINEQGMPGFVGVSWGGILVPQGVPKNVIDRLSKETQEILQERQVQEKMQTFGVIAVYQPPEAMGLRMKQDFDKWGKVIEEHHLIVN